MLSSSAERDIPSLLKQVFIILPVKVELCSTIPDDSYNGFNYAQSLE